MASIDASTSVLLEAEWVPADADEAMVRVREYERLARRLHAARLGLQEAIGRSGVHREDGHASAKVMVRFAANLSNAEALRRERSVRVMRDLPVVAAGHAEGRIGTPQVERIGRVVANPRVADQLIEVDAQIARAAAMLPYPDFDAAMSDWERLADEDGAGDRAERNHANRDFTMPRNLDGSHRFDGGGGSGTGQVIEDIWQRQVDREWEADWADARRRLGDAATSEDLARTDAQRRYDAMATCFTRGDLATYGVAARTCTDLVIDEVTFERHLAKLFGTDPGPDPRLATWWDDLADTLSPDPDPDDDNEPDRDQAPDGGLVGFRCGTIDGRPLDPTEVVVATLVGHIRRVVTRADGVVVNMGRKARCFTGARQLAVRLAHTSCVWPGCDVPAGQCQSDHLDAYHGPRRGRTDPGNGAPECGRHNRKKEQGFTIERDRWGRWHTYRPDGTEIT
ncbi:MAG: hypothetical protein JWO77_2272 [Ilumatobacteraceae bacterium]|nr:hypothetical protein [Ilumatobacteraceae bacterium]